MIVDYTKVWYYEADYTGTWVARPMVVADVTSCAARSILQFFR